MKLKIYSFIICVTALFFNSANSQIYETSLDQGTSQNTNIPVYSYYGYSYSQSIYLASEFLPAVQGTSTEISKLSFFNVSGNLTNTDNWTILIGQTSKTSFQNGSDWEASTNMDIVYDGSITSNGANGWIEIELDATFLWDGVSNIVVGVRDQASGYTSSQIQWGTYDVGVDRSMRTYNDYTLPNLNSPPFAQNLYQSVPKIKFEHINYVDCQVQSPAGSYNISVAQTSICDNEVFEATFDDIFYITGLTYQWQMLDNGTWIDFANSDSTYFESMLSQTTDIRVKATCSSSGVSMTTAPQTITVSAAPSLSVNFQDIAFCDGNPAAIMASGATSYSWSPATGLSNNNTAVVNASPTNVTTYEVTGSSANGCISVETVKVSPLDKVTSDFNYDASALCSAPTTINFEVTGLPTLVGTASWEYQFMDENNNVLVPWGANSIYPITAPIDSVYKVKYVVRSTECPTIEKESTVKNITVGFGSEVIVENYNCTNLGGSINAINDFGQASGAMIYQNDFSDPSNTTDLVMVGNTSLTNGMAVITPSATGNNGSLIISPSNQTVGSNNSFNVSFDLTVDLPINTYGTGGADGFSYSFANDITNSNANIQNGRGSKLRLSFDSADNSPNLAGVYLVYGKQNTNAPTPTEQTTLAYNNNISSWKNKADVPVEISIQNGEVTVIVDGMLIFDNVTLPATYMTEDVSNWEHSFSAQTGGDANRHAISNLTMSTDSYEFGLSTSLNVVPTVWQTDRNFDNLTANTYYLWMRKDAVSNCQKMVQVVDVINTNPLVDLGSTYTICEGDTVVLDAGNPTSTYVWNGTNVTTQTYAVTNSGNYVVQVTDTLGCTGLGSVIVNVDEAPSTGNIVVNNQASGATVFTLQNVVNGDTYDWDFGDGNTVANGSSSMTHIYTNKGTFNVSVMISNDCGDTTISQSVDISVILNVMDEENQETVKVYPNPSNEYVTIDLGNTNQANIKILDLNGKVVYDLGVVNSSAKLDVSGWSKGVYFAHVNNANKNEVLKIVVE
ncbi:T9SS type A sorting domain-containing protein [Brumimicrobium mesophilum]|uniref:T9SS type A sorting domain-containing protein n=1 Tax=Brumimicrobium mesophilum TaxID=392717 RepID=UPI000D14030C|nr:T9SS type A sorting domain-containing protein [Brumimicrobium mesophilum]